MMFLSPFLTPPFNSSYTKPSFIMSMICVSEAMPTKISLMICSDHKEGGDSSGKQQFLPLYRSVRAPFFRNYTQSRRKWQDMLDLSICKWPDYRVPGIVHSAMWCWEMLFEVHVYIKGYHSTCDLPICNILLQTTYCIVCFFYLIVFMKRYVVASCEVWYYNVQRMCLSP